MLGGQLENVDDLVSERLLKLQIFSSIVAQVKLSTQALENDILVFLAHS
jgi:hypothetical protein